MGNFAEDTALTGSDGHYRAQLSRDWEIWGPNGGYVAAIALRAAGLASGRCRPASFACHYLSVARFEPLDVRVTTLRSAKRAESLRVSLQQQDRAILEALVWTVDDLDGPQHDQAAFPDVPKPADLTPIEELLKEDGRRHRFWDNFDRRPVDFIPFDEFEPGLPLFQGWHRFRPQATFDDPYLDAARCLLLIDTVIWPAAWRAHGDSPWIAPSLDCFTTFHRSASPYEWLLVDAVAPVADGGLVGGTATVWSEGGQLLASGGSQLMFRPAPPGLG